MKVDSEIDVRFKNVDMIIKIAIKRILLEIEEKVLFVTANRKEKVHLKNIKVVNAKNIVLYEDD